MEVLGRIDALNRDSDRKTRLAVSLQHDDPTPLEFEGALSIVIEIERVREHRRKQLKCRIGI
jgi:hypothetical protein